MRKKMRLAQHKCVSTGDQHDLNSDDSLSRFPDEILLSILYYLPIKDAAITSQLSRRWRYLWRRTVHLDFDDDERMKMIVGQPKLRLSERNRYINWVNRVMCHHNSLLIEDFHICFDLDKQAKGAITKWIEFALSKNVRRLKLDLMEKEWNFNDPAKNFVFPSKILDKISGSSLKRQSLKRTTSTKGMEIRFLKTVILKCINVSDEIIGKMLLSCTVLEDLVIYNSSLLVNVKISGIALALTNLEIKYCFGLESIEICDSNLASFVYLGFKINLKLNNNPRLKTISIGEGSSGIENNMFQQISNCIPYLQVLELNIYRPMENMHLLSFPDLPNVKELSMIVGAWEDDSLLGLTWLSKVCPNLQKFMIQLLWETPMHVTRELNVWVKHTYQYLEVVVIGGYYGRISDLELALYFLENSVALKKVVINPTNQVMKSKLFANNQLHQENFARIAAKIQMEHIKSPGVEVEIL